MYGVIIYAHLFIYLFIYLFLFIYISIHSAFAFSDFGPRQVRHVQPDIDRETLFRHRWEMLEILNCIQKIAELKGRSSMCSLYVFIMIGLLHITSHCLILSIYHDSIIYFWVFSWFVQVLVFPRSISNWQVKGFAICFFRDFHRKNIIAKIRRKKHVTVTATDTNIAGGESHPTYR